MKKIKMLVINVSALALMLSSSIMCFAAVGEKSIYIDPTKFGVQITKILIHEQEAIQQFMQEIMRYPISGIDTFSTIQCQVTNGYDYVISDVIPLKESNSNNTIISIKKVIYLVNLWVLNLEVTQVQPHMQLFLTMEDKL
ncbi:MAG: hypothetical protein ACLS5C_08240 [Waltera sp.]